MRTIFEGFEGLDFLKAMFEGFEKLNFPTLTDLKSFPLDYLQGSYLYVFFFALLDRPAIPFYVGQTEKSLRIRMWDYCSAQFQAPTDFWVGEAIKYLREKGHQITVRYRTTSNPHKDEEDLIRELQVSGPRLLNGLKRHRYQSDEPEAERRFIRRFCDLIVSTASCVDSQSLAK